MAALNPPAFQQAGTYSARLDRLGVITAFSGYSGFSTDESQPLRIRQGVRPSYTNYQLKVRAASTPNMTVLVSAGIVVIDNHDLAGYGSYTCINDADTTLTIGAADATRYRRDTVVAQVLDAETAGGSSAWSLAVVSGPYAATAGAVTRGTLPPNAQILADILVGPAVTSIGSGVITDVRNYAVAAGGAVPLNSTNDMDHPHPGQLRYRMDTDTWVYGKLDGSSGTLAGPVAWTPMAAGLTGTGVTDNGNSEGPMMYRVVGSSGVQKLQLQGGIGFGTDPGTGSITVYTLPVAARPSVRRTPPLAKSISQGIATTKADINTDGTITVFGTMGASSSTSWVSFNGVEVFL